MPHTHEPLGFVQTPARLGERSGASEGNRRRDAISHRTRAAHSAVRQCLVSYANRFESSGIVRGYFDTASERPNEQVRFEGARLTETL